MGRCAKCGRPAGFGNTLCAGCDTDRSSPDAGGLSLAAQREEQRQRVAEYRNAEIDSILKQMLRQIELFGQVSLHHSVYLPVDSVVQGESLAPTFSITELQRLGLVGWEVVGVVPRTIGIDLQNVSFGNTSGKTYGGGIGGNVAGVHVLLQRTIRRPVTEEMEEELRAIIDRHIAAPPKLPGHYAR